MDMDDARGQRGVEFQLGEIHARVRVLEGFAEELRHCLRDQREQQQKILLLIEKERGGDERVSSYMKLGLGCVTALSGLGGFFYAAFKFAVYAVSSGAHNG